MFKYLVAVFIMSSWLHSQEQNRPFDYPLAVKPLLNANFGEMRPNHFHMGLDLNTGARENLPIFAPADGYLSRIKIESGGFGRALYFNHGNGTTTVYAHMNSFLPAVEQFLEQKQYEQETWKIDLQVPVGKFMVKKGQLIGYSGNTGASEGPHVHFEVRDIKTENCLNPLRNGISMEDNVAPEVLKLAVYDYDKSIYEQTPVIIPLIKKGSSYVAVKKIEVPFEKVVIGIIAIDRMSGSSNPNGIYKAILKKDKLPIAGFELDNISYDFTRSQNGHIDYPLRFKGGPYVQMLHRPKFFQLSIYPASFNKPYIVNSNNFQEYQIDVSDAHDNISKVTFDIRKIGTAEQRKFSGKAMMINKKNVFESSNITFEFSPDAFYDSFHMDVVSTPSLQAFQKSNLYQVQPFSVPVNSSFQVAIKSSVGKIDTTRMVIKKSIKGKDEIKKAIYGKNGFTASFKELGSFQLLEDLEPPSISINISNGAQVKGGDQLVCNVSDNFKSIRSFEARVDGKWLMFKPRGNSYSYRIDEHFPLGEHFLTVIVFDEAGNRNNLKIQVKRN
ncbi:MAG: M23 family metallopeptidase [Chitinophagia bacterium]|nr:M23 family metallopeptidase [Chitinophagia bacterium]